MLAPLSDFPRDNIGIYGTTAGVHVANGALNDQLFPNEKNVAPPSPVNFTKIEVVALGGGSLKSADSTQFMGVGMYSFKFFYRFNNVSEIVHSSFKIGLPFEALNFGSSVYGETVFDCKLKICDPTPCSCSSNSSILQVVAAQKQIGLERSPVFTSTTSLSLAGQWFFNVEVDQKNSKPNKLTIVTYLCNSALNLPTRAPYTVEMAPNGFTASVCNVTVYVVSVEPIYMDARKTASSSVLPLSFYTNSLTRATKRFDTMSMKDPRAFGINFPQFYAFKNVFPLVVTILVLLILCTGAFMVYEEPSWILAKALFSIGEDGKAVISPAGKAVVLDGFQLVTLKQDPEMTDLRRGLTTTDFEQPANIVVVERK